MCMSTCVLKYLLQILFDSEFAVKLMFYDVDFVANFHFQLHIYLVRTNQIISKNTKGDGLVLQLIDFQSMS